MKLWNSRPIINLEIQTVELLKKVINKIVDVYFSFCPVSVSFSQCFCEDTPVSWLGLTLLYFYQKDGTQIDSLSTPSL